MADEEQKVSWVVSLKDQLSDKVDAVTAHFDKLRKAVADSYSSLEELFKRVVGHVTQYRRLVGDVTDALDKASGTVSTSAQNIDNAAKSVESAAKAASSAAKQVAQNARTAFSPLAAAMSLLSGNFEVLGKQMLALVTRLRGVHMSMMRFSLYAALVVSVVKAVKALADYFRDAGRVAAEIKLNNAESGLKSMREQSELFAHGIEEARKNADALTSALKDELDALEALTKAQSDFNKAQELALARTDDERKEIELRYSIVNARDSREFSAERRKVEREALDGEIGRLQEELKNEKENEKYAKKRQSEANRYIARGVSRAGRLSLFRLWDMATGGDEQTEYLQNWSNVRDAGSEMTISAKKRQEEISRKLESAKRRREMLDAREEAARLSDAAAEQTEHVAAIDAGTRADTRWRGDAEQMALELRRLEDAAGKATAARRAAEEKAGRASGGRKELLEFARQEKEVDEELANTRLRLDRERIDALSKANSQAERERIESEHRVYREWAGIFAEERRQEIARARERYEEQNAMERRRRQVALDAAREEQAYAASRLEAARSTAAAQWGFYADRESLAAHVRAQDADAAARAQYAKDIHSVTHGRNAARFRELDDLNRTQGWDAVEDRLGEWRRRKLVSVNDEAAMRVGVAQNEERRAELYAQQTAEATQRSAESLANIESALMEGGEE